MGWISITNTRLAGALSLLALVLITISDFTFTEFWDENAMATSIVADVLVLVVGVAVVNEFLATRARRRWQLVADYAVVELARSCRRLWVGLAEQIGAGKRAEMTRDELREVVRDSDRSGHIRELAERAADSRESRAELYKVVSDLVFDARAALTSWAGVLVESTYSGVLGRFAEMQALFARLDLVLWQEDQGKRPSTSDVPDPAWIARRICKVLVLACELELELFAKAEEIEERERRELAAVRPT